MSLRFSLVQNCHLENLYFFIKNCSGKEEKEKLMAIKKCVEICFACIQCLYIAYFAPYGLEGDKNVITRFPGGSIWVVLKAKIYKIFLVYESYF